MPLASCNHARNIILSLDQDNSLADFTLTIPIMKLVLFAVALTLTPFTLASEQEGHLRALRPRPRPCPLRPVQECPEGTEPKTYGPCDLIKCVDDKTVRDRTVRECRKDIDCGVITCVTAPCPQPVCRAGKCVDGTV